MLQFIEVYKTNTRTAQDAEHILRNISRVFPNSRAMFDLDDIDSILRIESHHVRIEKAAIQRIFSQYGLQCELLESYEGTPLYVRPEY